MDAVKDAFGNEVSIGDYLVHVVKKSTDVAIHYSLVYGFVWTGYNKEVRMKVVSVRKSWRGEYRYYRATLTSNNFVKVSSDIMPQEIVKGLLQKVKV